jgi:hypothetical protein
MTLSFALMFVYATLAGFPFLFLTDKPFFDPFANPFGFLLFTISLVAGVLFWQLFPTCLPRHLLFQILCRGTLCIIATGYAVLLGLNSLPLDGSNSTLTGLYLMLAWPIPLLAWLGLCWLMRKLFEPSEA